MFDDALNLEEQHIEQGRQDGIKDGRTLGFEEGRQLGLQKGFEIGNEIGFYIGCVQAWHAMQRQNPTFLNPRAEKATTSFQDQLDAFPLNDPKDERIQEMLDSIRGKYKAISAQLGLAEGRQEAADRPDF